VVFDEYITGMLERFRDEFTSKGVELRMPHAPPAATLMLCPKRLDHVFLNLFNNASDFMPAGGHIILCFEDTAHEIAVEVEDSGPGLKPETASRLFTPFFTDGKPHGTGLGLSICKNVIEDHGGKIHARAEPGRGAIFRFTLPRPAC
jgi:signal transduction histidine kinase